MRAFSVVCGTAAALFIIGCGGTTTVVQSPSPATPPAATGRVYELPYDPAYAQAVTASTRTDGGAPGPAYWTQHTDYDLQARLLPDEKRLEGVGRIVYRNHSPDDLTALHLELSLNVHAPGVVRNEAVPPTNPVQLLRVSVDGTDLPADDPGQAHYAVDGTRLVIIPPASVPAGGEVTLEIDWSLDIPAHGAAGRMGHDSDELFFLAYWYPTMSVYDDVEGWHTDPFRGNAEFYHGFADYDVRIQAPADWVLHATGDLVNEADVFAPDLLERLEAARASDTLVRVLDEDGFGRATAAQSDSFVTWHFRAPMVNDFTFSATACRRCGRG